MEKIKSSVALVTLLFLVETKNVKILSEERKIAVLEYNILYIKFT